MKTIALSIGLALAGLMGASNEASAKPRCGTLGYYDVVCTQYYNKLVYCGYSLKECLLFRCPSGYTKLVSSCAFKKPNPPIPPYPLTSPSADQQEQADLDSIDAMIESNAVETLHLCFESQDQSGQAVVEKLSSKEECEETCRSPVTNTSCAGEERQEECVASCGAIRW